MDWTKEIQSLVCEVNKSNEVGKEFFTDLLLSDRLFLHDILIYGFKFHAEALPQGDGGSLLTLRTRGEYII